MNEIRFHTVYKITNMVNNKIYVGYHSTLDLNDSYFGSGNAIKAAIKKYGRENFIKDYLHICNDKNEALYLESIIVNSDFVKNESNYNLVLGGGAPPSAKGRVLSDEHKDLLLSINTGRKMSTHTKNRLRESNLGREFSDDHKARISKSNKGQKRSDEVKAKMSAAQLNRIRSDEELKKIKEALSGRKNPQYGGIRLVTDYANNSIIEVENLVEWCKDNDLKYSSFKCKKYKTSKYKNRYTWSYKHEGEK